MKLPLSAKLDAGAIYQYQNPSPGIFDQAGKANNFRHKQRGDGDGKPCPECNDFFHSLHESNPITDHFMMRLASRKFNELVQCNPAVEAVMEEFIEAVQFIADAAMQHGYEAGLAQAALSIQPGQTVS